MQLLMSSLLEILHKIFKKDQCNTKLTENGLKYFNSIFAYNVMWKKYQHWKICNT